MKGNHMRKTYANLPAELEPDRLNELVRIGSRYDGGYVIAASLLQRMEYLLSFGLGFNWDFERDVARLTSVERIECYDHTVTPRRLRRVALAARIKYPLHRLKYGARIAAAKDYPDFFAANSKARHHMLMVSASEGTGRATLSQALERLDNPSDGVFLKCDIEGTEYEIAGDVIASANHFIGIAIEFHDVAQRLDEVRAIVEALRQTHFIDHVHANNFGRIDENGVPDVLEISFSRRDTALEGDATWFARAGLKRSRDGEAVDAPNGPDRPDIKITWSQPARRS